jgi:hypothetical protein
MATDTKYRPVSSREGFKTIKGTAMKINSVTAGIKFSRTLTLGKRINP